MLSKRNEDELAGLELEMEMTQASNAVADEADVTIVDDIDDDEDADEVEPMTQPDSLYRFVSKNFEIMGRTFLKYKPTQAMVAGTRIEPRVLEFGASLEEIKGNKLYSLGFMRSKRPNYRT